MIGDPRCSSETRGHDVWWASELPPRADVVVVGAGIAGTSVALQLARRGLDVLLLEREGIASGASGRNDGQLLLEAAEFYSRMVEMLGRETAREVLRFKVESQRRLHEFLADRQLLDEVEWIGEGSYFLASSPAEEAELRASADLLAEDGFPVEWHDAATVADRISTAAFSGGLFARGDALVQPRRLTHALAQAAHEAGTRIHCGTPVVRVGSGGVTTPERLIEADIVVLCTNAWTGELIGRPDWIWPVRGQILATQPLPPLLAAGCSTNHGYEYWRQDRSGRLIAGGFRWTAEEEERGVDLRVHDDVQRRIETFLRGLYEARVGEILVEYRWSGIMGFSRDGLPFLGPLPGQSSLWLAAGFTGYGMSLGYGFGECTADLIVDGRSSYPYRPFRTSRLA